VPRQIIDTESSRPAYRRRVIVRWTAILLIVVVLVVAGVSWWRSSHHALPAGAGAIPGNAVRVVNQGPVPGYRSRYVA
jgi:hypothetical protein